MTPPVRQPARQTEGLPAWAARLSELYFSGTTSLFALHGNVQDLVPCGESYGALAEFLTEQIFGRWDLVLHFDLARGLRAFAGSDGERLKEMVVRANRRVGDLTAARRDPAMAFAMLDRFVQNNIMAAEGDRVSAAIVIDHAGFLLPAGEPGRLSLAASTQIVTLLNWASSPHLKRLNMAFVLIEEKLSALSERLVASPHTASIEIPLPDEEQRLKYIGVTLAERPLEQISDYTAPQLAANTAGISLIDLNVMLRSALEGRQRLDPPRLGKLKKELIERQSQGLLEFIEPRWNMDMWIGHPPIKQRLRDDALLLKRGELRTLPMGYLVCGPVGTGKSFLAQCVAGEIGIPCVVLRNFRSKYVGETEGNLERLLNLLRALGPVVVVVDEADAALGDRDQQGDSGTSSRVFSMIATQMGDTRYRGKILWMLLTARPDLLPIDLKRQGRAEVHIPLFYPSDPGEIRSMFLAMARKSGASLTAENIPEVPFAGLLSGADVEGIVGRAQRQSLLAGSAEITRERLADAIAQFLPSTGGMEKELQEIAAILECTDREFLTPAVQERIDTAGGRPALQERYTALLRLLK
ncbi:MAG: AAA family ATPase [Candidatus Solibacter sp.]